MKELTDYNQKISKIKNYSMNETIHSIMLVIHNLISFM